MKKIIQASNFSLSLLLAVSTTFVACGKSSDGGGSTSTSVNTTEEVGQQIGEQMSALDESGGFTNGSISLNSNYEKTWARLSHDESIQKSIWLPEARAAACSSTTFSGCASSSKTRSFSSCSIGIGATISGSVVLNFSGTGSASCMIPATNDSVTRVPSFTITGARGATFVVSVASGGTGQTLTRTGTSSFSFNSDGIRRVFTASNGTTYLDITTKTTSALLFTGSSRSGRVLSSGTLQITNNLNSKVCTLTPSSLTWGSSGCNCPTSGSLNGTCASTGESVNMTFNNTCGSADITRGSESKSITLDRCN